MLHKGTICLIFCVFNVELVEKSEDIICFVTYTERVINGALLLLNT